MCIDNFDTWFEVMQVKSEKETLYSGTTEINKFIFIDQLKDKFEECWNNAFQAGKEERDEEVKNLKQEIYDLSADNNDLSNQISSLEDETEGLQDD